MSLLDPIKKSKTVAMVSETDPKDLFLIYIHKIGENSKGKFEYEFLFSQKPNLTIGVKWEKSNFWLRDYEDRRPEPQYVDRTTKLTCDLDLEMITETDNFRMLDAAYGIVAIAWEYIDYDLEMPENILVFKYGESLEEIDAKLFRRDLRFL